MVITCVAGLCMGFGLWWCFIECLHKRQIRAIHVHGWLFTIYLFHHKTLNRSQIIAIHVPAPHLLLFVYANCVEGASCIA